MADVFISYSQKDREVAKALADFLTDHGYDIWWDYELVGGVKFRNEIKKELAAAKAAIVIWTTNSVESDWVIEEAEEAKYSNKLIATRIESLDFRNVPLGFRGVHTELVTEPDRILKALANLGVSPSHPPAPPSPAPIAIGRTLDPEVIAKAEQFAHWEFIKDSQDPVAFDRFLDMFPTSSFAALARAQLDKLAAQAWASLGHSANATALEAFVRRFPKHARAAEAEAKLRIIRERTEEAASWDRIKHSDDLAAVDSHLARFPDGINAPAARARREALRREREATEHWRQISDAKDPAAFEGFLTAYGDSPFVAKARERLDEINRALENADWNSVRRERHPAPLLHFLVAHPAGAHAEEALAALANLPKALEEEGWAAIKDSNEPIVLQGFLAALPYSGRARDVRTRLKTATAGTTASLSKPTPETAPDPLTNGRGKRLAQRILFWIAIGLLGAIVLIATADALDQMRFTSARGVGTPIAWAAFFIGVIALLLFFAGARLHAWPTGPRVQRRLFFHAVASIGLAIWAWITQAIAEPKHLQPAGGIDNVNVGAQVGFAVLVVIIAVTGLFGFLLRQRLWARIVYYILLLLIGLVEFMGGMTQGFPARDYWVTHDLFSCGGLALLLFAGVGLITEFVARRQARAAALASSPPSVA